MEDAESRARYAFRSTMLNTRTIDRTGGTFLHSSRTNPAKMKAPPEHLAHVTFPRKSTRAKARRPSPMT